MCNFYAMTKKDDDLGRFFRVSHNRRAAFAPVNAIFPDPAGAVPVMISVRPQPTGGAGGSANGVNGVNGTQPAAAAEPAAPPAATARRAGAW